MDTQRVSRHLGLLLCNIGIMKRFLPLLMLTGLLFAQDTLNLKSGESFTGTFIGKVAQDIVFKIEGEKRIKNFSINDVNSIITKNGELIYSFNDPNLKLIEDKELERSKYTLSQLIRAGYSGIVIGAFIGTVGCYLIFLSLLVVI